VQASLLGNTQHRECPAEGRKGFAWVEDNFFRQIDCWMSELREDNTPSRKEGADLKRNHLGNTGESPVVVFYIYIDEIGMRQT